MTRLPSSTNRVTLTLPAASPDKACSGGAAGTPPSAGKDGGGVTGGVTGWLWRTTSPMVGTCCACAVAVAPRARPSASDMAVRWHAALRAAETVAL
ncbi:hypothetical protein D3C72_1485290 [compost metagenome]